jgi:hypothetical protein
LPSEGHLFNLNEDVKIKFTGPENELYSLKVKRDGGGYLDQSTGTMIQGQKEALFGAGVMPAGDYIAQVRVGDGVYTGPTVLSRSFTIEESSSS